MEKLEIYTHIVSTATILGAIGTIYVKLIKPILDREKKLEKLDPSLKNRVEELSQQLERNTDQLKERIEEVHAVGLYNQMSIKKLELLREIKHHPERADNIERLFKEYQDLGGNGYIEGRVADWRRRYGEMMSAKDSKLKKERKEQ